MKLKLMNCRIMLNQKMLIQGFLELHKGFHLGDNYGSWEGGNPFCFSLLKALQWEGGLDCPKICVTQHLNVPLCWIFLFLLIGNHNNQIQLEVVTDPSVHPLPPLVRTLPRQLLPSHARQRGSADRESTPPQWRHLQHREHLVRLLRETHAPGEAVRRRSLTRPALQRSWDVLIGGSCVSKEQQNTCSKIWTLFGYNVNLIVR